MQFCVSGFEEVFPLWALSTVASGGLDWTTQGIGQVRNWVCVPLVCFGLYFSIVFIEAIFAEEDVRCCLPFVMFGQASCAANLVLFRVFRRQPAFQPKCYVDCVTLTLLLPGGFLRSACPTIPCIERCFLLAEVPC